MAEHLIQDTTLTNIADEVRTLSDSAETMTPAQMETKLSDANTEVTTQTDLLEQIIVALEGKVGGLTT